MSRRISLGKISTKRTARVLPYDAEVEYLESTGTQWIDTGVKGTLETGIYVHAIAVEWNNAIPLGVGQDGASPRIICFMHWLCCDFFAANGSGGRGYITDKAIVGSHYYFWGDKNSRTIKRNNVVVASNNNAATGNFTTANNIWLFNSSSQKVVRGVKVVSARLTEGDKVIRDFQPVRFTNELVQTEGAMYDHLGVGGMNPDGSARDDGLYRNCGTGSFLYGPDK